MVTDSCCPGPDLRGMDREIYLSETRDQTGVGWWQTEYLVMLFTYKTISVCTLSSSVKQVQIKQCYFPLTWHSVHIEWHNQSRLTNLSEGPTQQRPGSHFKSGGYDHLNLKMLLKLSLFVKCPHVQYSMPNKRLQLTLKLYDGQQWEHQ